MVFNDVLALILVAIGGAVVLHAIIAERTKQNVLSAHHRRRHAERDKCACAGCLTLSEQPSTGSKRLSPVASPDTLAAQCCNCGDFWGVSRVMAFVARRGNEKVVFVLCPPCGTTAKILVLMDNKRLLDELFAKCAQGANEKRS